MGSVRRVRVLSSQRDSFFTHHFLIVGRYITDVIFIPILECIGVIYLSVLSTLRFVLHGLSVVVGSVHRIQVVLCIVMVLGYVLSSTITSAVELSKVFMADDAITGFINHNDFEQANLESRENHMIEAMRRGVVGEYYVQYNGIINNHIQELLKPGLSMRWLQLYRVDNLEGRILRLQNISNHVIDIHQSDFTKHFRRLKAINFEKKSLYPREKTKAYIVFSNNE